VLILRPIASEDLDPLVDLARQLDSMNLPADRDFLSERIALSQRSFGKQLPDWRQGIYVFVLEDTDRGRCVGTCTIIAKHGRPGAPYFWLAVTQEERRSAELRRRFVHTTFGRDWLVPTGTGAPALAHRGSSGRDCPSPQAMDRPRLSASR
jgi:arginine N-succinyltransferase